MIFLRVIEKDGYAEFYPLRSQKVSSSKGSETLEARSVFVREQFEPELTDIWATNEIFEDSHEELKPFYISGEEICCVVRDNKMIYDNTLQSNVTKNRFDEYRAGYIKYKDSFKKEVEAKNVNTQPSRS